MIDLIETYWNNRYLNNDTGWDAGVITRPIKEYIDSLTNKNSKILIPGAGNAHEAEYLFNNGFKQVFVLDFAEAPLKNIQHRCKQFPTEHLLKEDFFNHAGQYDLIIEQTFFCAINPSQRTAYAKQMHSLLKQGGELAGVLFNDQLNTEHPPFGGSKEEYLPYFIPYFEMKKFEPCYNSIEPRAERELFIRLINK